MIDLRNGKLDLDHHRMLGPAGEESLTQLEVDALRYLVARPGQVVSREQLEREVWRLAPGARSEAVPVAMRRLRKKLGAGALTTVRGAGWRLERPPIASTLPAFATPFVGREGLLDELDARFRGDWRLVTLRGPGGVGKTRIAQAFAARWRGEVVSVSLLGMPPTEEALAMLIADASRLADAGPGALRRGLSARGRALLCLDDADSVAAAIAPSLRSLVRDVPGLRILVTSRAALGAPEESVLEVPPFGPELARRFFVDRLRGVHPDPEHESAALDEVVALLDGLPAALELYAARGGLGLTPLLDELRSGRQEATLDAQVQTSFAALDEADQDVLLACSAFVGSFPIEAARAASGDRLDRVQHLRQRSLLQLDPRGQLFMLATVRRFCGRRAGAERERAWRWVLGRAEAASEALHRRPGAALDELRALRPHLIALARGGPPDLAARAALAASAALAITGPTALRLSLLEAVHPVAPAERIAAVRVDLARARRLAGVPVAEVAALLDGLEGAEVALSRADQAVAAGDPEAALRGYADALALAPDGHWVGPVARARRCASQSLVSRRSAEAVDEDLAAARAACERHGLVLHLPEVLRAAASVATSRGDLERARADLGSALALAERSGLGRLIGELWNALGITWYLDDLRRSDACFARATEHASHRGDEALSAIFQMNLAGTRFRLDRPEEALRLLVLPAQVLRNPVATHLIALMRAGALFATGEDIEAQVALDTVDRRLVGLPYSAQAALHGELLARFVAAEARLRALDDDPQAHLPALRALLDDAQAERQLHGASMLAALASRVERRLSRFEPNCSIAPAPDRGT